MYNLTHDRFIRTDLTDGGPVRLSLPELFEALRADRVSGFPALRPHQRAAWHMLLAQLGAIASYRSGLRPETAEDWADALLRLAPVEAWDLVGEKDDAPAFLQPPMSGPYKDLIRAADAIDVLLTSKNHMVKAAQAVDAGPDVWLFALVSLQTMQGGLGKGNFGISRMNSSYGSRPFIGIAPPGWVGAHVMRDIDLMLEARADLVDRTGLSEEGHELLWTLPWDGTAQLRFESLAPWYVDVCRRVRLRRDARGIFAERENSTVARVDMTDRNGITGDHWAPINLKENKLYTADARGFNASVACALLLPSGGERRFALPDAMRLLPSDQEMRVLMRVLVRGQGKTEGYHEREIPFRRPAVSLLRTPEGAERLADLARDHLTELDEISGAIRYGVIGFCAGGDRAEMRKPSKAVSRQADTLSGPIRAAFLAEADALFFDRIQDRLDAPGIELDQIRGLIDRARELFLPAMETFPVPSAKRLRSLVAGERAFSTSVLYGRGRIGSLRDQLFPNTTSKETLDETVSEGAE